jgi:hypothetical protein
VTGEYVCFHCTVCFLLWSLIAADVVSSPITKQFRISPSSCRITYYFFSLSNAYSCVLFPVVLVQTVKYLSL